MRTKSKRFFVHPVQHSRHLQVPRQARYVYTLERIHHENQSKIVCVKPGQHSRHLQVPRQARSHRKGRLLEIKARSSLYTQDNFADLLHSKVPR
jgi:hypothetical protein